MKYLKTKFGLGIAGLAVIIIIGVIILVNTNGNDIFVVENTTFTKTVVVSGKVVPAQEIDLSFEIGGEITGVFVDIGDTVKAGDLLASLNKTEFRNEISASFAQLESERAKLSDLINGGDDNNKLNNIRQELLSTLNKTFVTADDIVRNNIDTFFDHSTTNHPDFNRSLNDYFIRQDIDDQRREVKDVLEDWKEYNSNLSIDVISVSDANYNITQLSSVALLLDIIAGGTGDFIPKAGKTQAQISTYISSISQSRTTVASLVLDVNQIVDSVRSVEGEVPVQQAQVSGAAATVAQLNSRLGKYDIVAPFDGIISSREIEPGEISSAGQTAIAIIGDSGLEIETFIPEVRVVGVNVGDIGIVTLDAFGDDFTFDTVISHVDPRETEKDGVTTYRTILTFISESNEIRPGMTADVNIQKERIENAIVIPSHFIQEDEEGKFVTIMTGRKEQRRSIEVGPSDDKGSHLIESGLEEGEIIIISSK